MELKQKNSKQKKLLVVSWGVYPSTGGSSIIVNNLAKGFSAEDLVIAGQRPRNKPKQDWQDFSEVQLYYLDPWPLGKRKGERYTRWLKTKKIEKELNRVVDTESVDEILAIFPDEFYCYVAMKVAKKNNIPFNIWFHNSYLENRSGIWRQLARLLQPLLYKSAKCVFVMSDGLNHEMSKQYPGIEFKTLVHGFEIKPNKKIKHKRKGDKLKFLYSGSLNSSCMDASVRMINALRKIPHAELHIFSGNPATFHEQGLKGDNLFFHDFLPLDEFVEQIDQYDIMLLPHGIDGLRSEFEYKTIFPTRTIPLLFSGRPILAHSPHDSFLTRFLLENECALVVSEKNEEKIRKSAEKLIKDQTYTNTLVEAALEVSEMFKIESVRDEIVKHLELDLFA